MLIMYAIPFSKMSYANLFHIMIKHYFFYYTRKCDSNVFQTTLSEKSMKNTFEHALCIFISRYVYYYILLYMCVRVMS